MNKRLCLKIARRVNTLLGEALGEGVRPQQMLDDPLYARDVLLVCDAIDNVELNRLGQLYRQALTERDDQPPAREPMSIGNLLNSIFGQHGADGAETDLPGISEHGIEAPRAAKPRRWFGRGTSAAK